MNIPGKFLNCNSIVGGAGTTYNETAITLNMAHPDEADNPGYFSAGTLTGIETIKPVTTSAEQQPCYDLLGRPVGNDYRGIVIKNGKKFIQH
ncbi:MAG: hypothetical protein IJ724_08145 [Muribaculaceae bacterium]|nr:hypothetical protein [Muribaculaceae bacterium]